LTAQILNELFQLAESVSLDAALLVRAAGVLYFTAFAESEDEGAIAALTKLAAGVTSLARARKGHATLLHASLAIKTNAAQMTSRGIDRALQQRVKQAFDPTGVFAPGRVVGGL
jgi:FAD/FMN-containing dehydrogenase